MSVCTRSAHVYIFWRDTTPLYVGCTVDLRRRMKEHRKSSFSHAATHMSVIPFLDHEEALRAETHYIRKLRPADNVRCNPRWRLIAGEFAWLEYDVSWFVEQPQWMQDLVNRTLDISPAEAAKRMRAGLAQLRWEKAA